MNEKTIVRNQNQQYVLPLEGRIAYSVSEASQLVGVSYTTLWRAFRRGDLRPIKGIGLLRISKKSWSDLLKIRARFHLKRKGATDNRIACE